VLEAPGLRGHFSWTGGKIGGGICTICRTVCRGGMLNRLGNNLVFLFFLKEGRMAEGVRRGCVERGTGSLQKRSLGETRILFRGGGVVDGG